MDVRVLRVQEVAKKLGVCRATVYTLLRETDFPKPIKLGGKAVGWVESRVDEWILNRGVE